MCLISVVLGAQNSKKISGTVLDATGEPVIGAAVLLNGDKAQGTVTDLDGKWTLAVPRSDQNKLHVSCMGYAPQVVEVGEQALLTIVLQEDTSYLDEVIVVGYGTMRKSDITGSVASVEIKDRDAGRSDSFDKLLKGRAPGVNVTSSNAAPGAEVNIQIRGASSFNGGGEPLYVVDGIILNAPNSGDGMLSVLSEHEQVSNGLLGINPQDIESMEILKDASATAIYGASGANGVILITTKLGKQETPVISFSSTTTFSAPYKYKEMLEIDEFVEYLDLMEGRNGAPSILQRIFVDETDRSLGYNVIPVNWQKYVMGEALSQKYHLSMSGKANSTNYLLSMGYTDNKGIVRNTGVDQLTLRLNLKTDLTKHITIGSNTNLAYVRSKMTTTSTKGEMGPAKSLMIAMVSARPYMLKPTEEDEDEDFDPSDTDLTTGPDKWIKDYADNRDEYRLSESLFAEVKLAPWLTFKSTAALDFRSRERNKWRGPSINVGEEWSIASKSRTKSGSFNADNLFLFNKKWGKDHNLSGTAGITYNQADARVEAIEGWNIAQYVPQYDNINAAPNTRHSYSESRSATLSYLARAVYSYKSRYILTATYRVDGSSKFQKANRYAYFPSFAAAWRVNKEDWFTAKGVDLKLRLGWGRVGNQALSSYQTLNNYSSTNYPDHSEGNLSEAIRGVAPTNLSNPALKWETTDQWNAGVDLSLFDERINATVDVYRKTTFDLLQKIETPASTGYGSMWINRGSIGNDGVEFMLDADLIRTKDLRWNVSGNLSYNKNKIIDIGLPQNADGTPAFFYGSSLASGNYLNTNVNIFIQGQPMALIWGYKTDGILQAGETGPGLTSGTALGEGSIKYVDLNGNGYMDQDDRQILGNPIPEIVYGFSTDFSWKNLNLSVTFNGVRGNEVVNSGAVRDGEICRTNNVLAEAFRGRYTPEKPNNKYPAMHAYINSESKLLTDRIVEDGSYLRLANVSLDYTIPFNPLKKRIVTGITLGVFADNVFCWTKYTGWDPDVNSYGSNMLLRGVDSGAYPSARSYGFNVKLNF